MAVASALWLPLRSVEREGGGENDARVWGAATATRFCSGENRGRPSDPNQRPRERLAFWAGKRPRRAGEGTPRRAVSAAWPLAVGPRAGFAPGLLNTVFRFIVFSIFPEEISIVF